MAGKTHVTKSYPTSYTNIPANRGGYGLAAVYKDFVGSPSKAELLKEYVHSPSMPVSPNYAPQNSSPPVSPNKHLFASPARGYVTEESNRVDSGPVLGSRNVMNGNMSLKTSTNNVNEGLGLTEESVYYSPRADPRRRGVLDDLSMRAQPVEPQKRYARPAFVARPNDARYNFTKFDGRK